MHSMMLLKEMDDKNEIIGSGSDRCFKENKAGFGNTLRQRGPLFRYSGYARTLLRCHLSRELQQGGNRHVRLRGSVPSTGTCSSSVETSRVAGGLVEVTDGQVGVNGFRTGGHRI